MSIPIASIASIKNERKIKVVYLYSQSLNEVVAIERLEIITSKTVIQLLPAWRFFIYEKICSVFING